MTWPKTAGDYRENRRRNGIAPMIVEAVMPRHAILPITVVLAGAGCSPARPGDPVLPDQPAACATRSPRPSPRPMVIKLAWRAEEAPGGAVTVTVGDIDAAPRDPHARRTEDYRHPADPNDCDDVRVVRVRGWWCTTSVGEIAESGPIVVGGGPAQARIRGGGFSTRCSGRPYRMRQRYQLRRDSWSGPRAYTSPAETPWTRSQNQTGRPPAAVCPSGRVGTYTYRLSVTLEIEGEDLPLGGEGVALPVGESPASSPVIRTSCGTGVS
jgi:hypothetical protein